MMDLTPAEYCSFNLWSRVQVIKKDGVLLLQRRVYDVYRVKLYVIYNFYIEEVTDLRNGKILRVEPVLNGDIAKLYLNK